MFLKSIEIFGFKSFADKSKINFGEGISTVVGPNGCGKSNIVDAIRWVLGEQSSKGIRLEKMSNVIFNGTEQRHPLNIAEVTLTFSNEENVLPLDFSEVSIKRRIFRNSNSEYFINDNQVALKELREILADTGIGVTEYIVMEQGRIDNILDAKPTERRAILEEAAGIKKFRMRSLDGSRKREKVQENIVQVEQILHEVEKQHSTLKIQSEKALKYRGLIDTVFSYEVTLECKKYKAFFEQLEKEKTQLLDGELILEKETALQTQLKNENTEFQNIIKDKEQESIELQKQLSIIHTEKDGVNRMLEATREHIREMRTQNTLFQEQLTAYTGKEKEVHKKIKDFEKEKTAEKKKLINLETNIKGKKEEKTRVLTHIDELKQSNIALQNKENLLRKAIEEHQLELRKVVDRLAEELDKRLSQTDYSKKRQHSLEVKVLDLHQQFQQEFNTVKKYIEKNKKISIMDSNLSDYIDTLSALQKSTDEAFRAYRDVVPSFLDDFLENDGVLSRKHEIDKKILALYEDQKNAQSHFQKNNVTIKEEEEVSKHLSETIHTLHIQQRLLQQQLDSMDREERLLLQSKKEIEQQITIHKEQLSVSSTTVKRRQDELLEHEKSLKILEKSHAGTMSAIAKMKTTIGKQHSEASVYQKKLDTVLQKIEKATLNIQNKRYKITETKARLTAIEEQFRDRRGEMIQVYVNNQIYIKKAKTETDIIKQSLSDTKQAMSQLGNINLLATEEFESVDERYRHIKTQLEDLYEADKDLQSIIEKIESESRIKMEATFIEVRKHFKTIFTRVMGGGKAELSLIGSDDILSAGLEIYAQPPEKKTEYLSQLSGGEKTLIALSLLFALHSVKPAPFCLLDELDAPLDDKNIDRFLDLLYSFEEATQFIVISHNKRSIAQARNIIGVTMEERGVSKFIGVKLDGKI